MVPELMGVRSSRSRRLCNFSPAKQCLRASVYRRWFLFGSKALGIDLASGPVFSSYWKVDDYEWLEANCEGFSCNDVLDT